MFPVVLPRLCSVRYDHYVAEASSQNGRVVIPSCPKRNDTPILGSLGSVPLSRQAQATLGGYNLGTVQVVTSDDWDYQTGDELEVTMTIVRNLPANWVGRRIVLSRVERGSHGLTTLYGDVRP